MSNGDEDQRVGEDTASGRTKRRAEKPISINLPQVHPRQARSPSSSFGPTRRAHGHDLYPNPVVHAQLSGPPWQMKVWPVKFTGVLELDLKLLISLPGGGL